MHPMNRWAACVAPFAVAALTFSAPARAQFTKKGPAYYVTSDYTLSKNIGNTGVFVGRDPKGGTLPGTFTLTVTGGSPPKQNKKPPASDRAFADLTVSGKHRIQIRSGSVQSADAFDTATVTITGGNVASARGSDLGAVDVRGGSVALVRVSQTGKATLRGGKINKALGFDSGTVTINGASVKNAAASDTSVLTISGGTVSNVAEVYDSSTMNISKGTVANASGYDSGVLNISGGAITGGVLLRSETATANFVGTGLSYAYVGYGKRTPNASDYADSFTVSGTFNGAPRTYTVFIYNEAGAKGEKNSAVRQFTLNGAAPVAPVAP